MNDIVDKLLSVYMYIYYYYRFVLETIMLFLIRFTRRPMPFYIYKVIVYDKDSDDKVDITDTFFKGSNYYNTKYFENFYIEYRILTNNKTHSRILEDPKESKTLMHDLLNKKTFQDRYLLAHVMYSEEETSSDVSNHILKYAGCNQNFMIDNTNYDLLTVRNVLREYDLKDTDKLILMTNKNEWKNLNINHTIERIQST